MSLTALVVTPCSRASLLDDESRSLLDLAAREVKIKMAASAVSTLVLLSSVSAYCRASSSTAGFGAGINTLGAGCCCGAAAILSLCSTREAGRNGQVYN